MNKQPVKFMPYSLWVYIVGWFVLLFFFIQIFTVGVENAGNPVLTGLNFLDFGVHEVSHMVASFFPPIVTAAAGSVGEISFVLLILFVTIKSKAYFAAVFVSIWVMIAMHNVGIYMADASLQLLPLVGPSEIVKHDWHYVFGELGWLQYDTMIGGSVMTIGTVIAALGLTFGLFLIYKKITLKRVAS